MTWGDPAGGRATTPVLILTGGEVISRGARPQAMHGPVHRQRRRLGGAGGKLSYSSDTFSIRGGARLLSFLIQNRFCSGSRGRRVVLRITRVASFEPLDSPGRVGMFGSIYDEIRPNARFDRMTFEPLELQSEQGDRINVKLERYQEQLANAFSPIEGVPVDAGEYDYWRGGVSGPRQTKGASGSINLGGGEYYDGERYGIQRAWTGGYERPRGRGHGMEQTDVRRAK